MKSSRKSSALCGQVLEGIAARFWEGCTSLSQHCGPGQGERKGKKRWHLPLVQGKGPPAKQRSVHLGRTLSLSNYLAVQGWASLLSLQKMPEGRMSMSRMCTVGYLWRLSRAPVHPCGSSSSPGCVRSREHLGDIPHYRLRGLESCSQTSSIWSRFPRAKHGQT